jgi:alpha-tubulin suppressor-like RCC1 family protein
MVGQRRRGWRAAGALTLLAVVVAVAATLPGGAAADQSSQPSSAAAGHLASGNFHTCAVIAAAVRCWGFGGDGQLGYANKSSIGDDDTPDSVGPVAVGAGRTVTAIAAGSAHTCALLDNGTVRCWGFGANGRLGYGNTDTIGDDELPTAAGPVSLGEVGGVPLTATAITAGNGHTCALLSNGAVRCWGFNLDGRLGLGHTDPIGDNELPGSVAPIDFGGGHTAKAITGGGFHTCAILDDDSVRCWGFGGDGRLGYGNIRNIGRAPASPGDPLAEPPVLPVESVATAGPVFLGEVGGVPLTAKAISAGFGHTCAVLSNDTVRCWGYYGSGRLGYGNSFSVGDDEFPGAAGPVDLGPGRTATAIDAGEQHTCAVLDNGQVRCWGYGAFGQLGYGNTRAIGDNELPSSIDPVDIGPGSAVAITAAERHSCVRLADGSLRCWGFGAYGRLGYCSHATIGDDELPSSIGPVALGLAGIPGTQCPVTTPPPAPPPPPPPAPPPAVVPDTPVLPPAQADALAAALAAQEERMTAMRDCRREIARKLSADRRAASSLPATRRRGARRAADRRAEQRRQACIKQHGRFPGKVSRLKATARANGRILLSFRVAGSIGSQLPAARRYLVKQSLRPIRTAADFRRAPALCKGACSFDVTRLDATATLSITDLRRKRRYYYAVAARDNVSARKGPRSATVGATTR